MTYIQKRTALVPKIRFVPMATVLMAICTVHGTPANADDITVCSDEVISGGTLDDVIVEKGTSCTLMNVVIDGNLKAKGAKDIMIMEVKVEGNVEIKKSAGSVEIRGAQIDGNLRIVGATSALIEVADAQIDGNVAVKRNTVTGIFPPPAGEPLQGVIFIRRNGIDGNLTVSNNEAPGLVQVGSCQSGGNAVDGNVTVIGNSGGIAVAVNCSEVDGNIALRNNTVVGGTIFAGDEDVQVNGDTVGGNVIVKGNTAPDQVSVGATVPDPIQGVVFRNVIDGNLLCFGNDPDPTSESDPPFDPVEDGNVVDGNLDCSD